MRLTLPWTPHAKQRPRVANGRAYTPAATKKAEAAIAEAFVNAMLEDSGGGFVAADGPLAVTLELADDHFVLQIDEQEPHTQRKLRGDLDNYAKTILDALNGLAWVDDKQIVYLAVQKT